jgi:flagellar hook assembly protein FlgD
VTVKVYDVSGALIKTLEDRDRPPGRYEVGWNGEDDRANRVSSGVYFYRMETHGFTQTRKIVVLK